MTPVQAAVGTGSRGRAGQVRVSRVSAARARRVPDSHARVSPVPVSRVLDKVSPLSRASAAPGSPLSRASGVLDSSTILSAILSEVPSAGIHSGELRSGEILSEGIHSVGIHSVEPCSAAASR